MKKLLITLFLASLACTGYPKPQKELPLLKAIVFYKPGCCQSFFDVIFPRLKKRKGHQLELLGIDISRSEGAKLYLNALLKFNIPLSQEPPLIIAGGKIFRDPSLAKKKFAGFVDDELGQKRKETDWPDIPGLKKTLKEIENGREDLAAKWITDKSFYVSLSFGNILKSFKLDPSGYILAATMEILMIFSLLASLRLFYGKPPSIPRIFAARMFPIFSIIGLLVALYLSFIKFSDSEAVCGPIGDCVSVQESSYAELFGLIPVAALGASCFLFILALWFSGRFGFSEYKKFSVMAIRIILMAGVAFFIYLTYLEIFIIGAVCFWCLTSALIMTLLLWTSIPDE